MKKITKVLTFMLCSLVLCFGVFFAGCKTDNSNFESLPQIYQMAVANGYEGTYEEWIASLKGEAGKDGKDGLNGKDGKDGLNGQNGQDGKDGLNGKSAYEIYCSYKPNYTKSESEWLNDLIANKVVPVATENLGDVNLDGRIDNHDITAIQKIYNGTFEYNAQSYAQADVDLNGVIDKRDMNAVMESVAGKFELLIRKKYGDVNLDGVVDQKDYDMLNNDEKYSKFSSYQKFLATLGYNYSREQTLTLLNEYLNNRIANLDDQYHFVEIDLNGFTADMQTRYFVKDNTKLQITVQASITSRQGFEFKGWVKNGNWDNILSADYEFEFDYNNGSITLTAYWEDLNASKNLAFDEKNVLIGLGTNTDTHLIIPMYNKGKLVTDFKLNNINDSNITTITIPSSIDAERNGWAQLNNFKSLETIICDSPMLFAETELVGKANARSLNFNNLQKIYTKVCADLNESNFVFEDFAKKEVSGKEGYVLWAYVETKA